MKRKKLSLLLLCAALVLTVVAAMLSGEADEEKQTARQIEFPNYYSTQEREKRGRRQRRLQLLSRHPARSMEEQPSQEDYDADPLLVAMSGAAARSDHVVLDLTSLQKTPIGQILIDCMSQKESNPISKFKEKTGRSPLDTIERVAITDDVLFLEGDFANLDVLELLGKETYNVAENESVKRFYKKQSPTKETSSDKSDDDSPVLHAAIWNDSMLMIAKNDDGGVEEAVGILEGKIPFDESVFPQDQAYGDLFGRMSIDSAAHLFESNDAFATRFTEVVSDVYLHVDASEDVAIVADVQGENDTEMSDLAVAMGGVLSVARLTARANGNEKLHNLLEFTTIGHRGDGFQLEVAFPLSYLEKHLADCQWSNDDH
ncbi:MAG: hypothetical protein JXR76_28995 [Deltaproteobacteria bacterium]|nr:hypothetical protein [Deltaproteobacteria bacterium]